MANWIANRCDNPSQMDIVDVKFEANSGQTISVNIEGFNYCYTLIEPTINEAKYGSDTSYDSCLECLNNSEAVLTFKPCFDGEELIILSNLLKFVPQVDKTYKLNLTITIGKEETNINDCYVYGGYVDAKPDGDIKFNSDSIEYKTCDECNPYKSNKTKFNEAIAAPFKNAKELYPNLFPK